MAQYGGLQVYYYAAVLTMILNTQQETVRDAAWRNPLKELEL